MEWVVAVSPRFKAAVALVLFAAIALNVSLADGVSVTDPTSNEITNATREFFRTQGYSIAGVTKFAETEALLVQKDACTLYAFPVAHQGWKDATVRMATGADSSIYFIFEGKIFKNKIGHLRPMLLYYLWKSLHFIGADRIGYPLLLCLVTTGDCEIEKLSWSSLSRLKL